MDINRTSTFLRGLAAESEPVDERRHRATAARVAADPEHRSYAYHHAEVVAEETQNPRRESSNVVAISDQPRVPRNERLDRLAVALRALDDMRIEAYTPLSESENALLVEIESCTRGTYAETVAARYCTNWRRRKASPLSVAGKELLRMAAVERGARNDVDLGPEAA